MGFIVSPLPLRAGTLALCAAPAGPEARAALAALAPALVVSMTEADESQALGLADLPGWLAARGIGWQPFPVADFAIPPPGADWARLAARANAALAAGQTVLLHCRGGLGRSGMVALRLMIEAGEEPGAALARLRAARQGAVETAAQEGWAQGAAGL